LKNFKKKRQEEKWRNQPYFCRDHVSTLKVRSHCASTRIAYSWVNQSKCPRNLARTL